MAIMVRIDPACSPLEEVARYRAKLRHGVASHEETQFIANPNPPNTNFEIPSYTPRDRRAEKGIQEGHMASIPPQNYSRPTNARLWGIQHTPTYMGSHISPDPLASPTHGLPLDFDDPEVLEGPLESEKVLAQLHEAGFGTELDD